MPVFALRFSADGKRLAIIADVYRKAGELISHLAIVSVGQPLDGAVRFEVAPVADEEESPASPDFGWSQDGAVVVAGETVVRVAQGNTCELPTRGVLLQGGLLVGTPTARYPAAPQSGHLTTYDASCAVRETWGVGENWAVRAASAARGLLLMEPLPPLGEPAIDERILVDPVLKRILRRFGPEMAGGVFAQDGKVLCAGTRPSGHGKFPLSCYDADNGSKIAQADRINGGAPIAAARDASRVVASDVRVKPFLFLDYNQDDYTARRVVWNFRSGKELAAWRPQRQRYDFPTPQGPKSASEYFRFAISPNGQYVAEGGNGIVSLYKIEP
jgi:hypothetical protein